MNLTTGRTILRAASVLLAAFLFGGNGPYTARLSPQDVRAIKTVAVIPALGNTFLFQRVQEGKLDWLRPPDSHFLEISDWSLDPMIAKAVTAALAKRFTVKPIIFRPADFSTWNYSNLKRASLDLNGDPAIDAYVFILRDWRPDEIGYSAQALGGLGLYRNDHPAKVGVFASYRIVVVDALTGDTIASRAALLPSGKLPWLPVSGALWPATPNALTDAQRATLDNADTKLIDGTLQRTLLQMNLTR